MGMDTGTSIIIRLNVMASDVGFPSFEQDLADLRLLHLADSALPIGGLAHSFGLESLVSRELLGVTDLPEFLHGFLEEAGMVEAVFCREAFRLVQVHPGTLSVERWVGLNDTLGAMKPARESRAGSASLGKNFLTAAAGLGDFPTLREALEASKQAGSAVHHSLAFGLVGGALGFAEDRAVLAYLHQSIASLVSACQRLLPLGQSAATKILWNLKPAILETALRSAERGVDDVCCFMPLLDWGAMEHPALLTRLFIS
jgi:urease accessory protein